MCRIFVANDEFIKGNALISIFDKLERSQGGDGNGVWYSAKPVVLKGTRLSTDASAGYLHTMALKHRGVGVFHTRLTSSGSSRDEMNHPFRLAPNAILVHNGTWINHQAYMGNSDTHSVANLIKKRGVSALTDVKPSGVWVIAARIDEKDFVYVKRTTSFFNLFYSITNGKLSDRFAMASELVSGMSGSVQKVDDALLIVYNPKVRRVESVYKDKNADTKAADIFSRVKFYKPTLYEDDDGEAYCASCGEYDPFGDDDDDDYFYENDEADWFVRYELNMTGQEADKLTELIKDENWEACTLCRNDNMSLCRRCPIGRYAWK